MAKNKHSQSLSPARFLHERGRSLEIEACYLNRITLEETGEGIGYIVRRHTGGNRTVGMYLIDRWCLGVKDAHFLFRIGEGEYADFMDQIQRTGAEPVPYEVLHNWVFGALEFAAEAGIAPHRDFAVAKYLLEDDEDERIPIIEYEFGDHGRYHLCVRSQEEAARYLPALHRTLGDDFLLTVRTDEWDEDEYVPEPPYTYRHPDYPAGCTFRSKALERLLTGPDEVPSDEEVRRILSQDHEMLRQDVEGYIGSVLRETADITAEEAGDDRLLLILALSLLGEVGDGRSLDVVLEVMRQSVAFRRHHFGVWTDTVLVPVIAALCPGSFDKLYDFLAEPGLEEIFRSIIVPGVCTAMYQQPQLHEEGIGWLRRVLKLYTDRLREPDNAVCGSSLAAMLVSHIIDARGAELSSEIRALFATGKVDDSICGTLDQVLDELLIPDHGYYKMYTRGLFALLEDLR